MPVTSANPGFRITDARGFHITFANGWTVSVQVGAGNYCDNYHARLDAPLKPSSTAEIAAWDANGNWHKFEHDSVDGYKTPADVLAFLNEIAAKPPAQKAEEAA